MTSYRRSADFSIDGVLPSLGMSIDWNVTSHHYVVILWRVKRWRSPWVFCIIMFVIRSNAESAYYVIVNW